MSQKSNSKNADRAEEYRLTSDPDVHDGAVVADDKKLPYPRAIPFIIVSKLFERFAYLGVQAVLVIYLTAELTYTADEATFVFHIASALVFVAALIGAIISDTWLGNLRTIVLMSGVFVCGTALLTASSAPPIMTAASAQSHYSSARWTALGGIALIAIGTGSLKPCLLAIGGDQYRLPQQNKQMVSYFSLYYLTLKTSQLIGTLLVPVLRNDFRCFGRETCFSFAFGVCVVSAALAGGTVLVGRRFYVQTPRPDGNGLVRIVQCILFALTSRKDASVVAGATRLHWLQAGAEKYGEQVVQDARILLNMLLLFVPVPMYWALEEQFGSRWTIQATGMNGSLGFYTIKPDQFQVMQAILVLIFVPLNNAVLFRAWARIGIRRPLQRMCVGGMLCATAFVLAGALESRLRPTYAVLPASGECQMRVFNGMPCEYRVHTMTSIGGASELIVSGMDATSTMLPANGEEAVSPAALLVFQSQDSAQCPDYRSSINVTSQKLFSYYITHDGIVAYEDSAMKSATGRGIVIVLSMTNRTLRIIEVDTNRTVHASNIEKPSRISLDPAVYRFHLDDVLVDTKAIRVGSVESLLTASVPPNSSTIGVGHRWIEITPASSVHMLWQLPQYVCLALGDAMFSVTGVTFTYAQAPEHMKTVMQACWLLMASFGHLIYGSIVAAKLFQSQETEFYALAVCLYVDMVLFMWLSYRYKRI